MPTPQATFGHFFMARDGVSSNPSEDLLLQGGNSSGGDGNGGGLMLKPGAPTGAGTLGVVEISNGTGSENDPVLALSSASGNSHTFRIFTGSVVPSQPALSGGDIFVSNTGRMWQATSAGITWVEKAPLDSPAFTGTPTAPTAPLGTDTTQIASTAYAKAAAEDAAVAYAGAALVVRTEADLPGTPGGDHTLPTGNTLIVGDAPLFPGSPPALQLQAGSRIVVPAGSTIVSLGSRGAVITGTHASAVISSTGGDITNLVVANFQGGTAADIEHTGVTYSLFRNIVCVGAGVGMRLAGNAPFLQFAGFRIQCETDNGLLRGVVLDAGASYGGITLESCVFNNLGVLNHVGFDLESGSTITNGFALNNGVFIGGVGAAGAVGVRINAGASIAKRVLSATAFDAFLGVGAVPLDGLSAHEAETLLNGNLGIENTAPVGALEMDAIDSGSPPEILTGINTWHAISPTIDTLAASSSLFDRTASGQLRSLSYTDVICDVRAWVSLEKSGGGSPFVKLRVATSADGILWTPHGIPQSMELTTTTSQLSVPTTITLSSAQQIRLELSTSSATTVRIRSFYLSARGIQ